MKKKAIEKIPYFGLKKTSRKKDVKYIGVTAVKIVGHEKHLFLEVYRNKKESKEIPMVRIVLTKKDFGTYWPEKEEWTRQKIKPDSCYGRVIWGEEHPTWEQEKKENILQSTEDLERIKKFCKANVYNEEHWWEYIYKHEDDIVITARRNREHKVYMRRQEALADRMAHTKELPEKEILDRADRLYFRNQHYLYYKKHGCWAHIACSKCGGVTDARWKSGISYESQFQRWTEEPREGHYGTCPMCGARGEYKCQGKVKGTCDKYIYLFLGQKYKENGMVMRYVEVGKKWTLGFICGDKGPEMYNASEELSGVEIARAYFEPRKKVQIDYHKHDPYMGKDFWDDCNLYGMANIPISAGLIMSETYEEMKGTIFQYSALQDTADEPGREETATEAPEPEDDGGAVGETGADDVQEIEKGGVEDHGAADEAGTGQEEDDTDGEESGQADCEEPAERTDEQTGAQSQGEEIAPAQKSTETLEKEEVEDDETGENESSDAENQTAESEPETAEREQTEETEVIEAVYGTRKEYMDRLSEQGMAEYMADEYKSHRLLVTDLANTWNLCKWLSEKVDRFGQPIEEE